jgi:hypothetical protein
MTRDRTIVLIMIVVALLLVFVALPMILPLDVLQALADPGGNHGDKSCSCFPLVLITNVITRCR